MSIALQPLREPISHICYYLVNPATDRLARYLGLSPRLGSPNLVTNDIILRSVESLAAGRQMKAAELMNKAGKSAEAARKPSFDLTRFVPYRLAVLADDVSETIAQVYVDRFDLSRSEWRILAWLGNHREMPAKEVAQNAGLDKMQMSRALAALQDKSLVSIKRDAQDRRSNILQLTGKGRTTYERIVPFALAREEYLLSALTNEEIAALDAIITKLRRRAISLKIRG